MKWSGRSRAAFCLDPLESRQLLSGVTLVTHGWQLTTGTPHWLAEMTAAIATRAGAGSAVYKMTIAEQPAGHAAVTALTRVFGPSQTDAAAMNGEAFVLLDWSEVSGVVISTWSTSQIADLVAPYLMAAVPDQGISHPLAQNPIHLIGHSRGGSLVSELADDLGRNGIWVDQVTTIDPHPVSGNNDPIADPVANVIFADNYFQTAEWPDGSALEGAHNISLNAVAPTHSGTHDWYHATITPGASTGYAYSRLGGLSRPIGGISTRFGGSGSRYAVSSVAGPQWPNISELRLGQSGAVFQAGQALTAQFLRQDADSSATVGIYFDNDLNPYNSGTYFTLADNLSVAPSANVMIQSNVSLSTAGVAAGQYFLMAQITDGQNTRYSYVPTPITITPAPVVGPDLSGSLSGVPASLPVAGKGNRVTLRVNNSGNRPAVGNVAIRLYASADGALDDSDLLLGTYTQQLNLSPGRSVLSTLTFNSPTNVPDGRYRLLAWIDAGSRISERSETNNVAASGTATSIRMPYADPKPVSYSFPSMLKRGSKQAATVTVQNGGSVPAVGTYTLRIYLAPDTTGAGAILLGQSPLKLTLNPGQKSAVRVTFTVPKTAKTGSYLAAVLDFKGTPRDRDTSNNYFYDDTTVTVL